MGDRVSIQSRPRTSTPMGLPVATTTVEDAEVNGLTGPLPLEAITELLLRVKQFHLHGTLIYPPESSFADEEIDYDMRRVIKTFGATPIYADELDATSQMAYMATGNFPEVFPVVFESVKLYSYDREWIYFTWDGMPGADDFGLARDENGDWWVYLHASFGFMNMGAYHTIFLGRHDSAYSGLHSIPFTLDLQCGSYSLKAKIGNEYDDGSLTITATEWFPYATNTGEPAWDTATGEAINGGPGA